MSKPQAAVKLFDAIVELEKKLPYLRADIRRAEGLVADAYAEASDPSKALDGLGRARDAHSGAVKALTDLDHRWYETAAAEYAASVQAISDKQEKTFLTFEKAVKAAFRREIAPLLKSTGFADGRADTFAEQIVSEGWPMFSDRIGEEVQALGRAPKAPRPRDPSDGHVLTEIELNRQWRPGGIGYSAPPVELAGSALEMVNTAAKESLRRSNINDK